LQYSALQEEGVIEEAAAPQGCLDTLYGKLVALSFARLYASNFCLAFFFMTLFRARR
jgi:hypothetical protein